MSYYLRTLSMAIVKKLIRDNKSYQEYREGNPCSLLMEMCHDYGDSMMVSQKYLKYGLSAVAQWIKNLTTAAQINVELWV